MNIGASRKICGWRSDRPPASCCYEVGCEVIDGFRERFADAEIFNPRARTACIDLLEPIATQLTAAGVESDRIHTAPLCTMSRTDLFFSYRREKQFTARWED